ncbi:hypothetical protein LEP1GSC013_1992 [Leptospira interrogans serovar Valbuzzi str. Duyster]|nr:hypothetical protein LEP1GSC013_1992 [Leptospira interrogans serovar Valbuzzi str. Duyster]ENO71650.1 hypothetical protein LEP1GSC012_3543 [Leptospira interrogans serovar Valbuzzi str. Valbuzzi]
MDVIILIFMFYLSFVSIFNIPSQEVQFSRSLPLKFHLIFPSPSPINGSYIKKSSNVHILEEQVNYLS